jgi:hypothetical protein
MAPDAGRAIVSTLFSADAPMDNWLREVDMLRPEGYLATLQRLLRRAGQYRAVVLDGAAQRDQIAGALISARRHPPAIVVSDATWQTGTSWSDQMLRRFGVRAIDGSHVSFCVHSRYEVESFERTWGPLAACVRFTPWAYTLSQAELAREPSDNGHVFAGGNSLRNYQPLIEAAFTVGAPVDIATSVLTPEQRARLPRNVNARSVAHSAFNDLVREASVVVVPLAPRTDRSSGQSVYINAMARGKAVVVTDAPGVRDYIEDGRTGLIVPPDDAGALGAAIRRLLDDPEERRSMGSRARDHALANLSLTNYARRLLEVAHETMAHAPPERRDRRSPR